MKKMMSMQNNTGDQELSEILERAIEERLNRITEDIDYISMVIAQNPYFKKLFKKQLSILEHQGLEF